MRFLDPAARRCALLAPVGYGPGPPVQMNDGKVAPTTAEPSRTSTAWAGMAVLEPTENPALLTRRRLTLTWYLTQRGPPS